MITLKNEAGNPFRDPAWRFSRAAALADQGRAGSPRLEDRVVLQLAAFLTRLNCCHNELERRRLVRANSAKSLAIELYRDSRCDLRCHLEAWILARESDQSIADVLETAPRMVAFYRQYFMDLRGRIDNHAFILGKVIRPDRCCTVDDRVNFRHFVLKLLSYLGGRPALERIVGCGTRTPLTLWRGTREIVASFADSAKIAALCAIYGYSSLLRGESGKLDRQWFKELDELVQGVEDTNIPRSMLERMQLES